MMKLEGVGAEAEGAELYIACSPNCSASAKAGGRK